MDNRKPSDELRRLIAAFGHSLAGIKAALDQPAFRLEMLASCIMAPLALALGKTGLERAVLIGSLLLVLVVELLNTGIETAIDRISTDIHPLSKLAKDVASGAVLVSLVNAATVWFLIVLT